MEPAGACARHWTLSLAAAAVAAISPCQRTLSTPARTLRRWVTFADGSERDLGRAGLLAPIERALRFLAGATGAVALAMVLAR